MEVIYLIGLDNNGVATHTAITEGNPADFENDKRFYVIKDYAEAESKLGKKWTGTTWEDVEQPTPAPPLPELPPNDILTLEAVAELHELAAVQKAEIEELKSKVNSIEMASFAALEGIVSLAEGQEQS